jgi:hypothetical protein
MVFPANLPKEFIILSNEAELSAVALCEGLTALRKADATHKGYYTQAFFSISTGLERLIKLVVILEYAAENRGKYPDNSLLRRYGHSLLPSFRKLEGIFQKYGVWEKWQYINVDEISTAVLQTLTKFAEGARYSNLDILTCSKKKFEDPVSSWQSSVGHLILKKYPSRQAWLGADGSINNTMEKNTLVMFQGEDGAAIRSIADLFAQIKKAEHINKYAMRHIVVVIQVLSHLLAAAADTASREALIYVPEFREFYSQFNAPKECWQNRKKWSIYY